MKFSADSVEHWIQGETVSVFFGNAEKELALLVSNVPGSSDHYFEWNDQSNACTNAVEQIRLTEKSVQIQLVAEAAKQIGERVFAINFACEEAILTEVSKNLKTIFAEKFQFESGKGKAPAPPKQDYSKIRYLNLEGKNLKSLPAYVTELVSLETAKLARNPELNLEAAFEMLARFPGLKHLTLTTENDIPENFGKLVNLETLNIECLASQTLPESVSQLKNLKYLFLSCAGDMVLPDSFVELENLENLYVRTRGGRWNLPPAFYRLSKLKQLDFSNCLLEHLPPEIEQMQALELLAFYPPCVVDLPEALALVAKIPNLKTLELCIQPVPKGIGLCRQIEELIIARLGKPDSPVDMPEEIFELTQLKTLDLGHSCIKEIPAAIGKLKNLVSLSFFESDFPSLPDSIGELSKLEQLSLGYNPSLRALPETIGQLRQLKWLNIENTPMLAPLPESLKNLQNLEIQGG